MVASGCGLGVGGGRWVCSKLGLCSHPPGALAVRAAPAQHTRLCLRPRGEWGRSQERQLQLLQMLGPGNSRVNRTECLPPLGTPSPVGRGRTFERALNHTLTDGLADRATGKWGRQEELCELSFYT